MIPAGAVRAFLPAIRAVMGDQVVILALTRTVKVTPDIERVEVHPQRIRLVELLELLDGDGEEEALTVEIPGPAGVTYRLSLSMED